MYLTRVKIGKYRILEDLEVRFQAPADDGANVVNVVAGVNGCGKTSLLLGIVDGFESTGDKDVIWLGVEKPPSVKWKDADQNSIKRILEGGNWKGIGDHLARGYQEGSQGFESRVFFFHAHLSSEFQPVSNLKKNYSFVNRIDPRTMLGNAEFYIREHVLA